MPRPTTPGPRARKIWLLDEPGSWPPLGHEWCVDQPVSGTAGHNHLHRDRRCRPPGDGGSSPPLEAVAPSEAGAGGAPSRASGLWSWLKLTDPGWAGAVAAGEARGVARRVARAAVRRTKGA